MNKENHNCDNVNCNHNNTKGLCCLNNPDNCKYRQLQKENAELKVSCKIQVDTAFQMVYEKDEQLTKAKDLLKRYVKIYVNPYPEEEIELRNEAEQFLNSEVNE